MSSRRIIRIALSCNLAIAALLGSPVLAQQESSISGLEQAVDVQVDDHGIPVITAKTYLDALAGQGWMQGQERFFQMDLMRRQAAGELSGIAGVFTVERDSGMAVLRRRELAARILAELPDNEVAMIKAYSRGVNAGFHALPATPIEYQTLGLEPVDWKPADTILVMLTMFDMLERQDGGEDELQALRSMVPRAYADWLQMQVSPYDALLIAPDVPETVPAPPTPDIVDARKAVAALPGLLQDLEPGIILGSNNFAVAGSRTLDGRAILASDPHLAISAPAIWYRLQLDWPGHSMVGLSLPGVPGIVMGTNGHVAWGMTNTTGDFRDKVVIEVDPDDPSRYRVPGGWEAFDEKPVQIEVRGGEPVDVMSRWTRWGPVLETDAKGRPIAVLSVPNQPGGVNFSLHAMADARTVDDAIEVARHWNGPSQNVLVADADGRIGWILSGWIPNRRGHDGRVPISMADGDSGWDGPLPEPHRPMLVDPDNGVLYTANNRTVPLPMAARIGHGFANPARAYRIRQRLEQLENITEADLLDMQLDEHAQSAVPFRALYVEGLENLEQSPNRDRMLRILKEWGGRSSVENVALPAIVAFRSALLSMTRNQLLRPFGRSPRERLLAGNAIRENAILAGFRLRPANLLPDGESGWSKLLARAAAKTLEEGGAATELEPWGEVNRSNFQHPLAMASPMMGTGFDLPSTPQSGYRGAVRVAHPRFGASARLVVSPNHLEDGILQTPGGQSGDPYSQHYTDLHQAWLDGTAMPLLPGKQARAITLVPRR
ncbi:MAG: penicillin acylase family protein [Phycisphaerales bacterium]|nr:penicillin acylase family protein [Phycisphaerales bacterium]